MLTIHRLTYHIKSPDLSVLMLSLLISFVVVNIALLSAHLSMQALIMTFAVYYFLFVA